MLPSAQNGWARAIGISFVGVIILLSGSHGKRKTAHLICNVLPEPHGEAVVVLHDACARRKVL
jgi:hypothetical protein